MLSRIKGKRIVPFIWMIAGSVLLGGLLASEGSQAHLPIYESGGDSYEEALAIPDISVSYAVYAEFEPRSLGADVQYYAVHASEGDELYFELSVPALEHLARFAPEVMIIGSGLPTPDEANQAVLEVLGITLPDGAGMLRWTFDGATNTTLPVGSENEAEFEPFGQVVLWKRQSARIGLPSTGPYYILVVGFYPISIDPNSDIRFLDEPFRYLLVTGYEERFGFLDFVEIPLDWIRIRMFWDENPVIFMFPTYLTVVASLMATGFYLKREKPDLLMEMPVAKQVVLFSGLTACLLMIGGGINQLYFLLISPQFDIASIAALVFTFQVLAIILGLTGFRLTFALKNERQFIKLLFPAAITVVALVVGSGFVVGPIAFFASSLVLVLLNTSVDKATKSASNSK